MVLERILRHRFKVLVGLVLFSVAIRWLDVSRELEVLWSVASGSYIEERPMDGLADTLGALASLVAIGINLFVNSAAFAWAWRGWAFLRLFVLASTWAGIMLRLIGLAFETLRTLIYLAHSYSVIDFDHPRQMEMLVYFTESSLQVAISVAFLWLYRTELRGRPEGFQQMKTPEGIAAPGS